MRKINLYYFNELGEDAKKVAIDSMRNKIAEVTINCDSYEYRNTLNEIEKIFEVKVYDWQVGYPTYYNFKFKNLDEDAENEPRLLLRYLNNNVLRYIDNRKTYYSDDYKKKRKSKVIFNKYEYCLTGSWCDSAVDDALSNIKQSILHKYSARDFVDSMLSNFFDQWKRDYEYASSDDNIEERIIDNEYEFTESGKPYLY